MGFSLVYLTEYSSIGTKKRCLSAVEIAIVPDLAIGLRIPEESLVSLLGALKTCLRYLRIVGIIDASSSCTWSRMFI